MSPSQKEAKRVIFDQRNRYAYQEKYDIQINDNSKPLQRVKKPINLLILLTNTFMGGVGGRVNWYLIFSCDNRIVTNQTKAFLDRVKYYNFLGHVDCNNVRIRYELDINIYNLELEYLFQIRCHNLESC